MNLFGKKRIEYPGERYNSLIPDTLDLAERARISINGLTGLIDRENNYEPYHTANFCTNPAYMNHMTGGACTPKIVEALMLTRIMSGSIQNSDMDVGLFNNVLNDIEEDGLWWLKIKDRPWYEEAYGEDTVWISMQSRLIIAFIEKYKHDNDPKWIEIVKLMIKALEKIAIYVDDYAYYPDDLYYRSGWKLGDDGFGASPFGWQRFMATGNAIRALSTWYNLSRDEKSLELACKLLKLIMESDRWTPNENKQITSSEHAHWVGFFHTYTATLWGVLEYAISSNNTRLKQFIREFYEYARNFGIPRIGFFPVEIGQRIGDDGYYCDNGDTDLGPMMNEGCGIADMICLAIRLSDAGIGDYWEDVDQYVRNHLIEHQLLDIDLLNEISQSGSEFEINSYMKSYSDIIERNIGNFVIVSDPTILYPIYTICCVGNCNTALYKAWESIIRYKDDTAIINLLLNRASPWLDIDSYLPYEGKVLLKNKTAKQIYIRIPQWVDKNKVQCNINEKSTSLVWLNNYIIINNVISKDIITILFPVNEIVESYTNPTYGIRYTCTFKGNTLIDITPRAEATAYGTAPQDDGLTAVIKNGYPLYKRTKYREGNKVQLVERTRFISSKLV